MKKNLLGIAILTTACLSATVVAQNAQSEKKSDAAPSSVLSPQAQWGTFKVTPLTLGKGSFNVSARMAPMVPLLEAIAKESGLKLILSDEVKNSNLVAVDVKLESVSPQQAIEHIATTPGLSWGKVGADTYLIVTQKLNTRVSITPQVTLQAPPVLRYSQPPNYDKPTPDAQPFDFNGQRYYRVPLQSGAQK